MRKSTQDVSEVYNSMTGTETAQGCSPMTYKNFNDKDMMRTVAQPKSYPFGCVSDVKNTNVAVTFETHNKNVPVNQKFINC
jgi:hypothetical protein